jgi:aminoglycoside/choline kinase family phosphotransferase
MVDIQDARWGPDTYDLASLLRDGYIEIDEQWIDPLVDLYLSGLDDPPAEGFRTRLTRVSAQRMIKALGTFGYQVAVRHDRRYLDPIPRTLARLDRILPELPEGRPLHTLLKTGTLSISPK